MTLAFGISLAIGFALMALAARYVTFKSGLPVMEVGMALFISGLAVRSGITALDRHRAVNLAALIFALAAAFVIEAAMHGWVILVIAFDIGRRSARQHLGFGTGPHYCLGSALERMEIDVVLRAIAARWDTVWPTSEPTVERANHTRISDLSIDAHLVTDG